MLEALDKKIIEKLTKFSHWFQKLTGLTCYFFAKIGMCISLLSLFIIVINYFRPFLLSKSSVTDVLALLLFGLIFTRKVYLCNKAEENLFSSEIIKVEKESIWFRILCLFCLIFSITSLLSSLPYFYKTHYIIPEIINQTGFFMGFTVYYYFIEVIPLPPGKSKIRQWIEGLFAPRLQPAPIPVKSDE